MRKKIVLFQPKSGGWDMAGIRPPDSLLAVAALPVREGYEVVIIDQRIDPGWREALRSHLHGALMFATTSMTGPQIGYALEASRVAKSASPAPVVWGGVHPSLLPEQTLQHPDIDIVVKGEGDFALLEVARALEAGGLSAVPGIYYKEGGAVHATPARGLLPDLDALPEYPYSLVDLDRYYGISLRRGRSITLMTSRGCPYSCGFCYNTVFNQNRWRGMSAARVIALIERAVKEFGARNIFFEDDNFCADPKRFEEIVQLLLRSGMDISWGLLGARVDTLKKMPDSLFADAVRAGCRSVDIGVESGSPRVLGLISKDIAIEDVFALNKRLAGHFERLKYTFIMGVPTETEEELMQSVACALALARDNPAAMMLFTPYLLYPGTELYSLAKDHGFREPRSLEEWSAFSSDGSAFWRYPWLDRRRVRMIKNFAFTSPFLGTSIRYKLNSFGAALAAGLYQPIARQRFAHNLYQLPVEQWLARTAGRM